MPSPSSRVIASLPFHEWASLRTELIWIYDRAVRAQYLQGKEEPMPDHRAWLIRRGTLTITTASRTLTAGAGTWIMVPQGLTEKNFSRNAHILSIRFLCQWPAGESILSNKEGFCVKAKTYPSLERIAKKMERKLRKLFPEEGRREQLYTLQSSDYGSFLSLQGLFFSWLALWFQIQVSNGAKLQRLTSGDSRPFQAARCLDQAPLNEAFPAKRLQTEIGLGQMWLNQLFFAEFGLTTRKYWDRRRLEFAKQCLETSQMPVKELSYRLGFRSDSHFVVWFRRFTGFRPGDFRRHYLVDLDESKASYP
jgi:AraC-like DNA-binding protein